MKFKIEIITRTNGKTTYIPYVRKLYVFYYWECISNSAMNPKIELDHRQSALNCIDNYYQNSVKSIRMEYINKP